jgi:2-polyprenyl-3-methyl-5-hydroxy-6-metoxy-1,4-benzoquinol methylase
MTLTDDQLTAKIEPFDSFWEAPHNVERGFSRFAKFYRKNYLKYLPPNKDARILVISCGPGYLVDLLTQEGYSSVLGIDSYESKIAYATKRGLNCRVERAFGFLTTNEWPFDVIFGEQEINHLTKLEIIEFLSMCYSNLKPGGTLIVHSINGATPLTGSESRAGNFDHYNSFTEYSLKQIIEHMSFVDVTPIPLDLYVFYTNPANYVAMALHGLYSLFCFVAFRLVGKDATIFTKKIGAIAKKPVEA